MCLLEKNAPGEGTERGHNTGNGDFVCATIASTNMEADESDNYDENNARLIAAI